MRRSVVSFLAAVTGAVFAGAPLHAATNNPFSPEYAHPYRSGVIPTYDVWQQMQLWRSQQLVSKPSNILSYGGGSPGGIGVGSGGPPKVYLVFYGNQWGSAGNDGFGNTTLSNDPVGAAPYLQKMFKGIGTGNEHWSGTLMQYCDGAVPLHAQTCPSGSNHIQYPTGGALAGVWYDSAVPSPAAATPQQLQQEAINAAHHFGNTTPGSNRFAQYMIVSPTGTTPDGFNTPQGGFCAWHGSSSSIGVVSDVGEVAVTNLPYIYDAGTGCSSDLVNGDTPQGHLDGFSIAAGHEYAEVLTDFVPAYGWTNPVGGEIADECGWGAHENVNFGGNSFAMQALWSNDTDECEIAHALGPDIDEATSDVTLANATKGPSNVPVVVNFSLQRAGELGFDALLDFHTAGVSAADGFDFTGIAAGSLTLGAGQANAQVPVTLLPAAYSGAPSRTFELVVDSATGVGPPASFATHQAFGVTGIPFSHAVADFNGDGIADTVTADWGSGGEGSTLTVRLNTTAAKASSASFSPAFPFTTNPSPIAVAVADFNGDGRPDLAVASIGALDQFGQLTPSNKISVLLNTTAAGVATPTFAAFATFTCGLAPFSIAAGDLNGDGHPDIATANLEGSVSVLLNMTSPGAPAPAFADFQNFPVGNNSAALSLAIADINLDGKPDLVSGTFIADGAFAAVFLNQTSPGSPTADFAPVQATPFGMPGAQPQSLALGDINGDGKADLVFADPVYGTIELLRGATAPGSTTVAFGSLPAIVPSSPAVGVALADINLDGKPDIVFARPNDGNVAVVRNATAPGSLTFNFDSERTFDSAAVPQFVVAADLNRDGRLDIVATDVSGANLVVLLNVTIPAAIGLSPGTPEPFAVGNLPFHLAAADLNADGKPDLVAANQLDASLSVLLNTMPPGATFPQLASQATFGLGGQPVAVAAADLNGDGRPELVAPSGAAIYLLRNTTAPGAATPTFAPYQTASSAPGVATSTAFADINGDGSTDLVVSSTGSVLVLLNQTAPGSSTFAYAAAQAFGNGTNGPAAVADFNGDGKPDIAFANTSADPGSASVLLNTTAPGAAVASFATQANFAAGSGPRDVIAVDLDLDGKPDLVVANANDDTITALRNSTPAGASTPSFASLVTMAAGSAPVRLAAADLDGDGLPDIVLANLNSGFQIFRNTGSSLAPAVGLNPGVSASDVAIADFNGDGQPDIASSNWFPNSVSVLLDRRFRTRVLANPATATIVYDYIFAAQFD